MRRMLTALACLTPLAAAAQQPPQTQLFNLSDEQIRAFMQDVREKIHTAKLPDGSTVPPESPAEKAQPLVSPQSGRKIIELGLLSGVADKCGVTWRDSKMPQAAGSELNATGNDKKAAAYLALLHGVAMNQSQEQTKECTPRLKERITAEIAARWK
jgi:hypothetical protein